MTSTNLYQTPDAQLDDGLEQYYQPKIFSRSGRIGRLRYLAYYMLYVLVFYLAMAVLGFVVGLSLGEGAMTQGIVTVAVVVGLIFFVAGVFFLMRRRLNDLGHSGWVGLLILVPVLNVVFSLYLLFAPGNKDANQYGSVPTDNHPGLWFGALGPIVFIGILAAIAVPAYQDYISRIQ